MIRNSSFEIHTVLVQCAIGIAAGVMNALLSFVAIKLHVPLFMDTLFTVTASCFGWMSGILAAVSLHAISFVRGGYIVQNLLFFFCSLTMVVCVRFVLFPKGAKGMAEGGSSKLLRMLILTLIFSLVISFEGGLVNYVFISREKHISGNQTVNMLMYTFVTQSIPILISAMLARFPVNLVDKAIAVFGGYGVFALLQKILFLRRTLNENQAERSSLLAIGESARKMQQAVMSKLDSSRLRGFAVQCAAGIIAGILNLLLSALAIVLKLPLFMDTLFTVTASCFGWTSGITAAISFHVALFAVRGQASPRYLPNMLFFLCSLTVVLCVRLILFRKSAAKGEITNPLRLLILGIVLALAISFEGGLFYAAIISRTRHILENHAVNMLLYPLMARNVPIPASATLISLPVNLIDKAIAVFGGYGLFVLLQKMFLRDTNMTKLDSSKMRTMLVQCATGIAAGFLNLLFSSTAIKLHVPLFMDTLFTVTASCFGWMGGIVAALASHIIGFLADGYSMPKDFPNLLYFFCSLTIVAGVRLVLFQKSQNADKTKPLDMLFLSIVLAFVISFEGGLFYVILLQSNRASVDIIGNRAVTSLIYTFVTKNIPMFIASPLASIPVNLVDKAIAVFGGCGLFVLLRKIGSEGNAMTGAE